MSKSMFMIVALALGLAGGYAAETGVAEPGMVELILPRPAGAGEAVWLQVRPGILPVRAEIVVRTIAGSMVGTVSPFGVARSGPTATYTVALPQNVIANGRVQLRLEIEQPGSPPRPAKSGEVESVSLIYVPTDS